VISEMLLAGRRFPLWTLAMFKHITSAIIRIILACCVVCDALRYAIKRWKRDA
jgi:hypothetical protein